MKNFADLIVELDRTTRTQGKLAALRKFFAGATAADAAWGVHFLCGGKLSRAIPPRQLREWGAEAAGLPPWLFEECCEAVGDLAETLALILPPAGRARVSPLAELVEQDLLPLVTLPIEQRRDKLRALWYRLGTAERFILHKLLSGNFRVGVSRQLVIKAVAEHAGVPSEVVAHRLMGNWQPTAANYEQLLSHATSDAEISQPYPFCLAHPLEEPAAALGSAGDYLFEWKWDGIRAQVIRRGGATFIWSRGEELIGDQFPEIVAAVRGLPEGTVLDGEIVGWRDGAVLPFQDLQRRIGRKRLGPKILRDVPVALLAFDLLELHGQDCRWRPLRQRRAELERLLAPRESAEQSADERLRLSPSLAVADWDQASRWRGSARTQRAEGLMLKRLDGPYPVGRPRGEWWKWKVVPYTIDAVLVYAQRGHGRRASLYTDYTFAVWDRDQLVPLAKAYSGLTDAEIRRVDAFVRRNTIERFGPVRSVRPELVFELAFEDLQLSSRHKSGLAVRFPRMLRLRDDLSIRDADQLTTIRQMLAAKTAAAQFTEE